MFRTSNLSLQAVSVCSILIGRVFNALGVEILQGKPESQSNIAEVLQFES